MGEVVYGEYLIPIFFKRSFNIVWRGPTVGLGPTVVFSNNTLKNK